MHRDKQNQFLTTFKKSILANKCGQIPHSASAWKSTAECCHKLPPDAAAILVRPYV